MGASSGELHSLLSGLQDIPSHLDALDNSNDKTEVSAVETSELEQAVVEAITEEQTEQESLAEVPSGDRIDHEAIQFISSHFSQFSDEDEEDREAAKAEAPEEELIRELAEDISSFPDVNDSAISEQPTAAQFMMASGLQLLTNRGQSLMSHGQALVSVLGSTDVSSLVANTMAGLSTIRDTVSGVVQQSHQGQDDNRGGTQMTESGSSGRQVDAEFEFLNEDDLAQVLENIDDGDGNN